MATITILNLSLSEEFRNIYLSDSKIHYSENEKDYIFSSEDKKFLIFKISEMIADFIVKSEERKIINRYHFNINLDNWILEKEINFIGNSHDKITQKIYMCIYDKINL